MLRRKLLRTAKVYRVQFISMILLVALGIGVFVGFNAEWVTIGKDTDKFFDECGFADYRAIDEDGIKKTIQWYLENKDWWEEIISGEYQNYYEKMYGNR